MIYTSTTDVKIMDNDDLSAHVVCNGWLKLNKMILLQKKSLLYGKRLFDRILC